MNIYAYILNNIVQTLALVDSLELADTLATDQGMDRVEDVTELDPRPQPGWIWIAGEAPVPGSLPPNPAARVCGQAAGLWQYLARRSTTDQRTRPNGDRWHSDRRSSCANPSLTK